MSPNPIPTPEPSDGPHLNGPMSSTPMLLTPQPVDVPRPKTRWRSPGVGPTRRSRPRTNKSTFLYRYFDADDELLYIGITDNLADRTHEHAWSSSWMDFAVRSTIERYKTRKEAEELEVQAIRSERPLFNMAHNDAPGVERRLIDYLIDHDRRDLLAVAVSRG